jgi:hydrogenase nickel incorporation protein HypA/HybF
MHELSVTRSVIAIVSEKAAGQRVTRIRLEIGRLSAILPEAVRFCFDVCARGTLLEGAALEIIEIPGQGRCSECGSESSMARPFGRCPLCANGVLRPFSGEELNVKEMEVEPCV